MTDEVGSIAYEDMFTPEELRVMYPQVLVGGWRMTPTSYVALKSTNWMQDNRVHAQVLTPDGRVESWTFGPRGDMPDPVRTSPLLYLELLPSVIEEQSETDHDEDMEHLGGFRSVLHACSDLPGGWRMDPNAYTIVRSTDWFGNETCTVEAWDGANRQHQLTFGPNGAAPVGMPDVVEALHPVPETYRHHDVSNEPGFIMAARDTVYADQPGTIEEVDPNEPLPLCVHTDGTMGYWVNGCWVLQAHVVALQRTRWLGEGDLNVMVREPDGRDVVWSFGPHGRTPPGLPSGFIQMIRPEPSRGSLTVDLNLNMNAGATVEGFDRAATAIRRAAAASATEASVSEDTILGAMGRFNGQLRRFGATVRDEVYRMFGGPATDLAHSMNEDELRRRGHARAAALRRNVRQTREIMSNMDPAQPGSDRTVFTFTTSVGPLPEGLQNGGPFWVVPRVETDGAEGEATHAVPLTEDCLAMMRVLLSEMERRRENEEGERLPSMPQVDAELMERAEEVIRAMIEGRVRLQGGGFAHPAERESEQPPMHNVRRVIDVG